MAKQVDREWRFNSATAIQHKSARLFKKEKEKQLWQEKEW